MANFLFHSGGGLLILSLAASLLVGTVVWQVVKTAVTLLGWACWRLYEAAQARSARPYSPGGKA
jgi:hypothetical protein